MSAQECFWIFCFVPPPANPGPKIFGFAEFVQALALIVVLYSIVDIRYKFRLAVASTPLYPVTFWLIFFIGTATLLTEVWIAEGWWLPRTAGLSKPMFQAILGALFLSAFLVWMYLAFIKPPVFNVRNAKRYLGTLYHYIVKGNNSELAVIANEVARSAQPLVRFSRVIKRRAEVEENARERPRKPQVGDYAHDILLLIANRKFCRHIVESSPITALAFFEAMSTQKKFFIPIGQFAKTVSSEAIENKESILHHEDDGFRSGLIGYIKPWSQTIYGDFSLLEALAENFGSPLDIEYGSSWDAKQWDAYCRATLTALKGYLTKVILKWTKKNYLKMREALPDVADAVLVGRGACQEFCV